MQVASQQFSHQPKNRGLGIKALVLMFALSACGKSEEPQQKASSLLKFDIEKNDKNFEKISSAAAVAAILKLKEKFKDFVKGGKNIIEIHSFFDKEGRKLNLWHNTVSNWNDPSYSAELHSFYGILLDKFKNELDMTYVSGFDSHYHNLADQSYDPDVKKDINLYNSAYQKVYAHFDAQLNRDKTTFDAKTLKEALVVYISKEYSSYLDSRSLSYTAGNLAKDLVRKLIKEHSLPDVYRDPSEDALGRARKKVLDSAFSK